MAKEIRAGFHSSIDNEILTKRKFSRDEIQIINNIADSWLVTKVGYVSLSQSTSFKYVLIKPTTKLQEMFNIEKEVGIIFSDYDDLQPRTLDAFDALVEELATWRIEKICSVLISKDTNVENIVNDFIRSDTEAKIIVPFSYKELLSSQSISNIIENKFRKYFYDRDLFSFNSPLKKDVYFFGRKDLIQKIINKHKSHENSGLFGLRKTGKTSVIFGIKRALERENSSSPIIIDCQDTSFNKRRWNQSLYYLCLKTFDVVKEMKTKQNKKISFKEPIESLFTNENASLETKKYLKLCKTYMNDTLFFIFDEIENISIKTSPVLHWKNGEDFIPFWQTLRSIFQTETNLLSYLIIGTNPYCIEQPLINNADNPIYNFITPEYISGFTVSDTKEMIDKLAKIMGLYFDETIFAKLTEDFGGHPFLIRQVCGIINTLVNEKHITKPSKVDRILYSEAKNLFVQKNTKYIEMILTVLLNYYEDEYLMLEYLATNNLEEFNSFAEDPTLTNHLLGYGIISKTNNNYDFKVDLIRDFILSKNKYKNNNLSIEDKWKEISERRNKIEPKLRTLIKMILKSSLGASESKTIVLNIFGGKRKEELSSLSYADLFNPNKSTIYFSDLSKIISTQWALFKNIFTESKQDTFLNLEKINNYRSDAHAKNIADEDFFLFRILIKKIETDIEDL